jgi:signal transduction histidine kinase
MMNMKLSIRLTLVMVGVVAATTIGILFFADQLLVRTLYDQGSRQLETRARLLAATVEDKLGEMSTDLVVIPETVAIRRLMRGEASRVEGGPSDIERLATFMKSRMANNPAYLSFGIIKAGNDMRYIVGVTRPRPEDAIHIVQNETADHLLNIDVYRQAGAPKSGEVHFTPIHSGVDDPVWGSMPILEISTPIIAPDGSLFGVVFIAADARPLLDAIKSMFSIGETDTAERLYVSDAAGRFFVQPDQLLQQGDWLLPPSKLTPMLASSGIRPHSQIVNDGSHRFVVASAGLNPARGVRLSAAISIPYAELMSPLWLIQKAVMLAGLFAAGLAIALGVVLARPVVRPLAQMTAAIEAFDPDTGLHMPATCLAAAGEIGILANSFQAMADHVEYTTARLKVASEERAHIKDEFVAMVSHELRTPLTSISASLGLLVADPSRTLSDAARRLLRIAHSNSQRVVRLLNDILDIEKIETGKIEFKMEPLDVCRLIELSIEGVRAYAEQFDVVVTLDPAADRPFVRGDADRFMQVITNLLSNAVKYSPSRGEVFVGVERRADWARISVRDHGSGIPEQFRQHIFEKFAQAGSGDQRQKGGTGLGLSIAKQIVQRLGGDIGFYDAPDGGTVFHVDLPRCREAERPAEAAKPPAAEQASGNAKRQPFLKRNREVA